MREAHQRSSVSGPMELLSLVNLKALGGVEVRLVLYIYR